MATSGGLGKRVSERHRLSRIQAEENHRWTQMNSDKNYSEPRCSVARIRSPDGDPEQGAPIPEFGSQNLYYNHASLCFLGKELAANEGKWRKMSHFLYGLWPPSSVVAAQAALGPSVSICGCIELLRLGLRAARAALHFRPNP